MILVALLAGLSAACTDSVATSPPQPSYSKWQPKQPRPADRDERAVDGALAALDFCELIDLAVYALHQPLDATQASLQAEVKDGKKQCTLYRDGYEDILDVRDVDPNHAALRDDGAVIDLGGVKGYQVETRREGAVSGCKITVPVSFRRAIGFELGLQSRSKDCALLGDFAAAGAAKLSRDLVYPPDGQDSGRVGACANWVSDSKGDNCDPAVDAQVPTGAGQILAAGAADPNFECAVFHGAVKKVFGPDFAPIATPGSCYFVEPRHRLQIEAGATANGGAPGEWLADPNGTFKDHRQTSLSGNPGVTFRSKDDREFSLYVSPLGNLDSRGHVRLRISPQRERGIDDWERSKVVSAVDVARAHAVMELVMATHFPTDR
ncbi:hypothetical protein [Amycolatopsis sp. lyj-112]|uniref:hypothetical protein n=1 Tax=Amycolatopsis sp. lyj-112 TaxID=2789288 RepID=UPI00397B1252